MTDDDFLRSLTFSAQRDQFAEAMVWTARALRLYYLQLTAEGFTPKQAMDLTHDLHRQMLTPSKPEVQP